MLRNDKYYCDPMVCKLFLFVLSLTEDWLLGHGLNLVVNVPLSVLKVATLQTLTSIAR